MPLNKDALTRYRLIDERLRNKMLPKPSLDKLLEYVTEKMDKTISRRTLQADLHDMRESSELNYNAPIAFDHYNQGYYYAEEDYSINNMPVTEYELQGLEIAVGILKQFHKLPVIRQFEDAILKIADSVSINRQNREPKGFIHLDAPPQYKGLDWIPEIASAIRTREILRIRYQSFDRQEPREYRIEPYHLREYNNRFYVFAKSIKDANPGLRTFGLDRIEDIWPTLEHFDEKNFDEASYFRNAIGITVPDEKPKKIILSFTPQQGKYLKTQPLHWSQKILKDDERECRLELTLVVNHELLMVLLGYGAAVKVIRPRMLADKILGAAADIQKRYLPTATKTTNG
jgi:predicted DNA-binding transcriptional regulator YafY